jgi:proteasome lid subunit RPN8/RPN11
MADVDAHVRLDYLQRLELLRIQSSAGVEQGSVRLGVDEAGDATVTLDLRTEAMVEAPKADVRDVERVHLVYGPDRRFGETAPTWIVCDRADFPREVGHLCAGPPGCPAVPCLSLGGMQPLYDRGGIEVVLERLRHFMRDAKTGTLMGDGWEPVPFAVEQKFAFGEIEPHFFQEHAALHPEGGHAVGTAIHIDHEGGEHIALHPQIIQMENIGEAIGGRNADGRNDGYMAVPWIFVWPSTGTVETDPIFQAWRDQGELREGLKRIGLTGAYDAAVGDLLIKQVNFRVRRPPQGGRRFAVVVGVWRPTPIMNQFFGYSDDPVARTLELRAYLVSKDGLGEIVTDDARVESLIGSYPPRPELLRWVSGLDRVPAFTLFGHGALGSAIFEDLVRAGADDVFVQDKDVLGSHNLARHSGRLLDVHRPKTRQADKLIRTVVQDGSARIETSKDDIAGLHMDALRARTDGRLVIDATAEESVRVRMDELRLSSESTIVRTELFDGGRLGTTFVSLPGGPTPSELLLTLIAAAVEDAAVSAWLDHEDSHPLGTDPMLYGFGCTSQTVRLPGFVVEQQAAVAVTSVLEPHETSGILINPLDERYRPQGCRWLPVAPFASLVPPTQPDWTIRMSAAAMDAIRGERTASLPNECGGYLYGAWDPVRRTVTVVVATSNPPGTQADADTVVLAPAGRTAAERRLVRKTHGRIHLCGTWHSHPGGSARLSGRDHRTMMLHHERDAVDLRPTLVVIVADGDIQAHLQVP